jgi:parvulin-like peptidyl-prolyl isomerase
VAADVKVVEEIAAKVNGEIVTRGDIEATRRDLEAYLRGNQKLTGMQLATALSEQEKDILKEKIDELLLIQKAKDLNINVDSEVNRRIAAMQVESKIADSDKFHDWVRDQTGIAFEEFKQKLSNNYLTRRVINQEVGSRIAIPEPDLRKYYDDHKTEFVRQEEVYLSQIILITEGKTPQQVAAAEAKAKDLVLRARKGEKFSELAQSNSDDTETARNGGQLPPRQRGQSLKEIDDFAFKEKKGSVSEPIKIPGGIVIVRLDERYEAGQASFEEVKDRIQDIMAEPRMAPKIHDLLTKLRTEAFLEIKDGYVDTGAAPGKDTRWHDVAVLKPQTTTKEEVLAHRKKKKFLGIIPHGNGSKKSSDIDTSTLGAPKEPAAPAKDSNTASTPPVKQ